MKEGLAIWHYPHRTLIENIRYFADFGFKSLSLSGIQLCDALIEQEAGNQIAELIKNIDIELSVHYTLPRAHSEEKIAIFEKGVLAISKWQREHKLISVWSFDVPQPIRDDITKYIDFVMKHADDTRIALEDFSLTEDERRQIKHLESNKKFGFLIDLGHLYLRILGENTSGKAIFSHSTLEKAITADYDGFLTALKTKEFPIFEFHLHNNNGVEDLHFFLEDGPLDMTMIAQVLKDFGFDGILTIESAPGHRFECSGQEADDKILRTYNYWKECKLNIGD